MAERYSLEQIAQTSDETIVRTRFDERNIAWAGVMSWIFLAASFVAVIYVMVSKDSGPWQRLVVFADATFTLFMVGSLGELRLAESREGRWQPHVWARAVGRNPTPWIMTLYILKLAAMVFPPVSASGVRAWALTLPFTVIGLRLRGGPRLFLHGAMLAVVVSSGLLTSRGLTYRTYIPAAVVNAGVFGIAAVTSRKLRRRTIAEWTERRNDAIERLRIRDELRFAREVQISMLPESAPALEWADVAGISIPATEVGGDYYDYFVVDGRLAVVCGDVAGHGLASGITLSALRSGFTLLRESLLDPASVLRRLQDVVAHSSRRRMMVTVSVLLLDPTSRRATISSAGHPPLLIVRGRTGAVETIELFAPPLGARLGGEVPQRVVDFEPGDVFVLHSDGVFETTNAAGEHFGLERLAALAAGARGTATEIRDAILRRVEEFRGTAAQEDDVTLVVVRV